MKLKNTQQQQQQTEKGHRQLLLKMRVAIALGNNEQVVMLNDQVASYTREHYNNND